MRIKNWLIWSALCLFVMGGFIGAGAALKASAPQAPSPQTAPAAPSAPAPQTNNQPSLSNQNVIRIEVPVVTVDVVVTDKKGKPVKGLAKGDFKLLEDGVAQNLTNFEYLSEEEPTGELASITTDRPLGGERQNYILFLFDNTSMDPSSQERSRHAAAKFIDENLRTGDLVAIANYRNSMQIVQNFSGNKTRLARALGVLVTGESIDKTDTGANAPSNTPFDRAQQSLRSLGAQFDARNLMIAMRGLFNSMRPIKGRKSLIVFSGGISLSADNHVDLIAAIDAANKANVTVYTIDAKGLSVDMPTPNTPNPRRMSSNSSTSTPALGSFVNSFQGSPRGGGGAPGGGSGRPGGGAPGGAPGGGAPGGNPGGFPGGNPGGFPGSNTGNPRGNTGNFPGNDPMDPNSNNPFGNRNPLDRRLDQMTLSDLKDVLLSMATETGGFYIRNSNDFNRGLQEIKSEMRNFYSLGYESNNQVHDGKFRAIKVEMVKKGFNIKYRKGYFDKKSQDALAGTPAEKPLNKAIEESSPLTALPVQLVSDYFYEGPSQARAPVSVRLPISKLRMKKDKGLRSDAIDILGVALREDGTKAARFSDTMNLRMENDQWKKLPENATVTFPNYFRLPPGKYRLKVAVHDEGDLVGTVEQPVEIPPYAGGQFTTSSLVLSSEVRPLSGLISSLESELLDDKNPLISNGMKVYQSVDKRFYAGTAVCIYFSLYNLTVDPNQKKPSLLLSYSLISNDKLVFQMPLSSITQLPAIENGVLPVGMWVPLKDLTPGHYTIQVMVRDGLTNVTHYLRDQFDVEAAQESVAKK
ncbi:MAG: VWA domain-containing protein [Acidobacteriia bacterium]|nr:VWA domain-containing protein [Terriglobia bacterium]